MHVHGALLRYFRRYQAAVLANPGADPQSRRNGSHQSRWRCGLGITKNPTAERVPPINGTHDGTLLRSFRSARATIIQFIAITAIPGNRIPIPIIHRASCIFDRPPNALPLSGGRPSAADHPLQRLVSQPPRRQSAMSTTSFSLIRIAFPINLIRSFSRDFASCEGSVLGMRPANA